MKNMFLLPNKYKKLGWIIFVPSLILGVLLVSFSGQISEIKGTAFAIISDGNGGNGYFRFITTDISNTVVGALFIIGGLLVGFSKE